MFLTIAMIRSVLVQAGGVRLQGVSHDVVDYASRRDELAVEGAREDKALEALGTFGEGVDFEAGAVFVVFNFHGHLDEKRPDATRRLVVVSVADLSSFGEMTLESVCSGSSSGKDIMSELFSIFVDVDASQLVVEVVSSDVQNLSDAVGRNHFASDLVSGGDARIGNVGFTGVVNVVSGDVEGSLVALGGPVDSGVFERLGLIFVD